MNPGGTGDPPVLGGNLPPSFGRRNRTTAIAPWRRPAEARRLRERSARIRVGPTARALAPDGTKSNLQGRALQKEKTR